jgi:hypothetical protein
VIIVRLPHSYYTHCRRSYLIIKITSQVKSPGRLHASFTHPPTTQI